MAKPRHAAIIEIGDEILLKFLDFEGGVIHNIRKRPEMWKPDRFELVLEHPDLPIVRQGDELQRVIPKYTLMKNISIRIEPKKRLFNS